MERAGAAGFRESAAALPPIQLAVREPCDRSPRREKKQGVRETETAEWTTGAPSTQREKIVIFFLGDSSVLTAAPGGNQSRNAPRCMIWRPSIRYQIRGPTNRYECANTTRIQCARRTDYRLRRYGIPGIFRPEEYCDGPSSRRVGLPMAEFPPRSMFSSVLWQ